MKNARQLLWGILITLISLILILGGVSLSLAEGNASARTKAPTLAASSTYQLVTPPGLSSDSATPPVAQQDTPATDVPEYVIILDTPAPVTDATLTATDIPYVISATPPAASSSSTSTTAAGTPRPSATPAATRVACGAPSGWVVYIIQPGDTLYHLSQLYGVTVAALQKANCMGSSTALSAGRKLLVPPGARHIPSPTPVVNTPIPTVPTYLP
jgi:LysM repeat protein